MFKYIISKIVIAILIIALGTGLLAIFYAFGLGAFLYNAFQEPTSPALIGVSIGGIAGVTVAIIEGMLSLWRFIEKREENQNKRAIIEALCYSPRGMAFDSIINRLEGEKLSLEKIKDIPSEIVLDLLNDLVMMGPVKVNRTEGGKVEYSLPIG